MTRAEQDVSQPSELDKVASQACTRSGTFALLLALFLALLIPEWQRKEQDIAFDRYLTLRLNLDAAIQALDDDFIWQRYKASHEQAESMRLAQLMEAQVLQRTGTGASTVQQKPAANASKETKQPLAPPAPDIAGIASPIYGIHEIAGFLGDLDDSKLLTTARGASGMVNHSIYRWIRKRYNLILRNWADSIAIVLGGTSEAKQSEANFVPAVGKETLLKYLTLSDVRELAKYELPEIPDTPEYRGEGGPREIQTTLGMLPRSLRRASLSVQVLLIVVIAYFWAFAREAITSAGFPVPGTLFSAFAKSRYTLSIFLLALWSPLLASASVAFISRDWLLIILSALVGFAVWSVHLVFSRRSYFGPF